MTRDLSCESFEFSGGGSGIELRRCWHAGNHQKSVFRQIAHLYGVWLQLRECLVCTVSMVVIDLADHWPIAPSH